MPYAGCAEPTSTGCQRHKTWDVLLPAVCVWSSPQCHPKGVTLSSRDVSNLHLDWVLMFLRGLCRYAGYLAGSPKILVIIIGVKTACRGQCAITSISYCLFWCCCSVWGVHENLWHKTAGGFGKPGGPCRYLWSKCRVETTSRDWSYICIEKSELWCKNLIDHFCAIMKFVITILCPFRELICALQKSQSWWEAIPALGGQATGAET